MIKQGSAFLPYKVLSGLNLTELRIKVSCIKLFKTFGPEIEKENKRFNSVN